MSTHKHQGYLLEQGEFGLRAVLNAPWTPTTQLGLLSQPVAELELNIGKGWRGSDLSFLADFPELLAFKISDPIIESDSAVHVLRNVRKLVIWTHCKNELRFGEFRNLIECVLEWRPKAMSLFDCISLRSLSVKGFRGPDTEPFARLRNLESLMILGTGIQSLAGLGRLLKLRSLRLGDMRMLSSLEGIESLSRLERLEINTCRKIRSIEQVGALTNLRELYLDNLRDIESLKPVESLRQLRRLTFVESTNIVDGDLSPLLVLPHLDMVSFQNRGHYSHSREYFSSASWKEQ